MVEMTGGGGRDDNGGSGHPESPSSVIPNAERDLNAMAEGWGRLYVIQKPYPHPALSFSDQNRIHRT
jgi:hypothetical protein